MSSKREIALQAAAMIGLLTALPMASQAAFVAPVHARGPDMMGFGPPPVLRLVRALELTEAQREQVFAIVDRYQPGLRKLMFALGDGRDALQDILVQGGFDPARLEQDAMAQGEAARSLHVTTAKMLSEISAALTPTQRARLAELQTQDGPMNFRGP